MKKPITVLIVDDNESIREFLRMLISATDDLQLAGETSDGIEAIALAKELSPDIILMDINMSPVNGFEATRKILAENPAAKIIGLSMHQQTAYARSMLQLGARGYVTKSGHHQEIIEAIRKVAAEGKYINKDLEGRL